MASTFTLTSSSYDGRYLQLSCSQTKDIATNKSKISWTLSSIGGGSNYYSTGPTTVSINGSQVYYSGRKSWEDKVFPAAKGSTSGTIYVDHDPQTGNKSIPVSLSTAIYGTTVKTSSGTWTLDSIPRQATITVASDFTDTANPTISFSNPGGFPMDVWLEPNPVGDHLCVRTSIPNTGSYTWTLSNTERDALRNKCSGKSSCPIRIGLYSYVNGVQYASYVDKTYAITNNAYTAPSVSITASPEGGLSGLYVQNKSKVKVSISATGKYGANITSYSTNVAGAVYNAASFTTGVIAASGDITISGFAVDSRGFSGAATKKITVVPYSAPWITSFSAERQTDGTTVIARLKGGVSPVENKNTKAFSVTLNGETKAVLSGGYDVDGSVTFTNVPTDSTLNAEAKVTDAFSTATKSVVVPTVAVTMDFHSSGNGVAFGKVAESANLLDIAWDIKYKGGIIDDFIVEHGTSGIWTYRKWNSGIAECWCRTSIDAEVNIGWGPLYIARVAGLSLPFTFANVPICIPACTGGTTAMIANNGNATQTTTTPVILIRPLSTETTPYLIQFSVWGRWK